MEILKQYLPINTRHKLVFTKHIVDGLVYADMGVLISNVIESNINRKNLPLIVNDAIEDIIKKYTILYPNIGKAIAIKNIGILFEPNLHLDLHSKFDSWAKSCLFIVNATEGVIKNNTFYLAGSIDQHYSINLSDISYKTIYDEI